MEDWAEIRRLHRAKGLGIKTIARTLGVSRNTVRGAQAISRALVEVLREHGGEIRYGQLVTGFDLDGDRAVAVKTEQGLAAVLAGSGATSVLSLFAAIPDVVRTLTCLVAAPANETLRVDTVPTTGAPRVSSEEPGAHRDEHVPGLLVESGLCPVAEVEEHVVPAPASCLDWTVPTLLSSCFPHESLCPEQSPLGRGSRRVTLLTELRPMRIDRR